MIDPNDFLHAQIRVGTGYCQIINRDGKQVLACYRPGNDRSAIRDTGRFIDQILDERARQISEVRV